MRVRLKVKGLDTAVNKLAKDKLPMIKTGISKIADIYRDQAKEEAPKKSGKLSQSIHKSAIGEMSYNIIEGKTYGLWVREGAIGHSIYPTKKTKALYWPGLSHPVAWVAHPGIRASSRNDYPERAVTKGEQPAQEELDRLGAKLADSMGGG